MTSAVIIFDLKPLDVQSRHCCAVGGFISCKWKQWILLFVDSFTFIIITKTKRHWQIYKEIPNKPKTKKTLQIQHKWQMKQCRHKFDLTDASINRNCCQFFVFCLLCCLVFSGENFVRPNVPGYIRKCKRRAHKYNKRQTNELVHVSLALHKGKLCVSCLCVMKVRNFAEAKIK